MTRPSQSAPANHETQTLSDEFTSLQSNMRQMKAVSTENSDSKNDLSPAFSCTKEAPLPLPLHRSKTWKRTRSVVVSLVADLQHFAPSLGCSLFAKARLGSAQKSSIFEVTRISRRVYSRRLVGCPAGNFAVICRPKL